MNTLYSFLYFNRLSLRLHRKSKRMIKYILISTTNTALLRIISALDIYREMVYKMSNNRRNRFYYIWSLSIILCLALVFFALIFVSCKSSSPEKNDPTLPPQSSGAPETAPPTEASPPFDPASTDAPFEPASTILQQTEDMGQEYLDKFVFMGDSTTNGLAYYGVIDSSRVWTPANKTFSLFNQSIITIQYPATGEELTIEQLFDREKPEYLMITLGVNGVAQMDKQWFTDEYIALVERIQTASPETKIIINSIYPVAKSYQNLGSINNLLIEDANRWLIEIAEATGTRFLNSNSVLIDSHSALPEELQNGDGMHLTGEAFEIITNYLRTHGYK